GSLDPTAEGRFDTNVFDGRPGADDRAIRERPEVAEVKELSKIVVPTRQVEQQVADAMDTEPRRDPPQAGDRPDPARGERRVEEGATRGYGNRRCRDGRRAGASAGSRGASHRYQTAT